MPFERSDGRPAEIVDPSSMSMAAGQAPDARQEAERLAASGAHEEALERFQAIAAANPDDIGARIWIGRLHMRMGHARRAAAVYESIVAVDPKNVEALAGLGAALVEAGDLDAAAGVLTRAEALAPERIDVLAAQGASTGRLDAPRSRSPTTDARSPPSRRTRRSSRRPTHCARSAPTA